MKLAIVTLAYQLPEWGLLTLPRIEEYAKRIGAEYVLLLPHEYEGFYSRQPLFMKQVETYDRVCFIDADCVVSREAPDIFAGHPVGAVWMAPDSPPGEDECHIRFTDMMIMQSIRGAIDWCNGYGNFGVTLVDRDHSGAFTGWLPIPGVHNDQANVNYLVRKLGYHIGWLDRKWNRMGITSNVPNDAKFAEQICDGAFIAHAAGFNLHPEGEKNRTAAIEAFDKILP